MKRIRSILAILLTILLLSGCTGNTSVYPQSDITFYYKNVEFDYGSSDGVIAVELRDPRDCGNTYEEILECYLAGPKESGHISPFPAGITLEGFTTGRDRAYLTLSNHLSMLEGTDLSVACACLTRTVLGMTGLHSIEISVEHGSIGGESYVVFIENDFSYQDSY